MKANIKYGGIDLGTGDVSIVYKDHEVIFNSESFCEDADEETKSKLTSLIIQYSITQEQVEVLWALSKDVKVVRQAAKDLCRGFIFPDHELAELVDWVRRCKHDGEQPLLI